MSNLREQLEIAKASYHAARYPGDLASELVRLESITLDDGARGFRASSSRVTTRRWFWAGSGGAAVAAAVAVAFVLNAQISPGPVQETAQRPMIFPDGSVGNAQAWVGGLGNSSAVTPVDLRITGPSPSLSPTRRFEFDTQGQRGTVRVLLQPGVLQLADPFAPPPRDSVPQDYTAPQR